MNWSIILSALVAVGAVLMVSTKCNSSHKSADNESNTTPNNLDQPETQILLALATFLALYLLVADGLDTTDNASSSRLAPSLKFEPVVDLCSAPTY